MSVPESARTSICQSCRRWFFSSYATVSGDGRSSGYSTLWNDGRVWGGCLWGAHRTFV